jgi:hypothetical protein
MAKRVLALPLIAGVLSVGSMQSFAVSSKKTATPAIGNAAGQSVDVNSPYCDAYAPYEISALTPPDNTRHVTSLLVPLKYNFVNDTKKPNDRNEVQAFLGKKLTMGSPVSKDGSFSDPGYPILGDPKQHLYADGTDVQRLLVRLFAVDSSGKPLTTSLCQDPSTKAFTDTSALINPNAEDHSSYYLVHIVRWKLSAGAYQTSESSWYIFNKNDPKGAHRQIPFKFHPYTSGDLRILGNNKVFFLAIHLAPIGATGAGSVQSPDAVQNYNDFRSKVQVSYKLAVTKVEPANIQDLKALLGVVTKLAPKINSATHTADDEITSYMAFVNSSPKRPFAGAYGAAVLTGLDSLPVQITATMQATLPKIPTGAKAPTASAPAYEDHTVDEILAGSAKQEVTPPSDDSGSSAGESAATKSGASTSNGKAPKAGTASKTASKGTGAAAPVSGCTNPSNSTCTDSAVIQNEGLYWWDVSVGVPFKGYKELQYSSPTGSTSGGATTGSITTTTVSKGTAYGFLALAPWKEDIVSPPSIGIPHFLVGLPLQGKVFDAPVFAAGETFNIASVPKIGPSIAKVYPLGIRFYCGIVYNKQFSPSVAGVDPTPSHRVAKLQYGIEFSIRSVVSKLSSATSGSKSNSKKSTTSANGGSAS